MLSMKEMDWKPFPLTPRPRYPQGYQNKCICDVNLFCWHVQKIRQKAPLSLKRWDNISGFIFPSSPLSLLIQRKVNLWK